MSRIFCIGETVYDIIFESGQPVAARPGGSMLNSAVSMGRMKLPVYFISEYGQDTLGQHIDSFLYTNGVNIDYIYHFPKGKTSIALAFLDEKRNASYAFYKELPAIRLSIKEPEFTASDYVLFGSYYSITPEIRIKILQLITSAKKAGATIIYDPNFRKAHLHELPQLMPMIVENMGLSSLIKASNEDLAMIFGTSNVNESYQTIMKYCPYLIYTQNSGEVIYKSPEGSISVPVPHLTPTSTIGAGDSFSAGFLYALFTKKLFASELASLKESDAIEIIQTGIDFATHVCLSYDNYISVDFAREYSIIH